MPFTSRPRPAKLPFFPGEQLAEKNDGRENGELPHHQCEAWLQFVDDVVRQQREQADDGEGERVNAAGSESTPRDRARYEQHAPERDQACVSETAPTQVAV